MLTVNDQLPHILVAFPFPRMTISIVLCVVPTRSKHKSYRKLARSLWIIPFENVLVGEKRLVTEYPTNRHGLFHSPPARRILALLYRSCPATGCPR